MKISVLLENEALSEEYLHHHGLSLYIETEDRKILFDTGQDDSFAENAQKMGIDLSLVDFVVISHGHYDHGGGIKKFMELNKNAPIYISEKAFGKYFYYKKGREQYIGLEQHIDNSRMIWIDDYLDIDENIIIFSHVKGKKLFPSTKLLKENVQGNGVPDDFAHEINLVIKEKNKNYLFCGCAHTGIFNIIEKGMEITGENMDYVIGGFHLMNISPDLPEDKVFLEKFAGEINSGNTIKYYTGHCTGEKAFLFLKSRTKKIESIYTAKVISI